MARGYLLLSLLIGAVLLTQGCSYRAWYQGLQDRQRNECYSRSSREDLQRCLDRVDAMSYDDYARLRKERLRGESQ